MAAAIAGAVLANLASNAMADAKAETANENARQNMFLQNMLNRRNNILAYSDQVQGAKMAGLNPAMLNGATPNVASPVSQPNTHMAENVEFDQTIGLLNAQRENIEADTAQKEATTAKIEGVDTENTKADTQAKKAATLLTQAETKTENNRPELIAAQTANTQEETQRIKNLNNAFAEENSAMGLFGQTMAQNWQKEPWYNKLSKGSKMVIDDIAQGNLDLTVGIANALDKSISTDQNMNETEKNKFEYELTEKVIEAQMKNPKVMKALEKLPSAQYNELVNRATKLATENKVLQFNLNWDKEKKNIWDKQDPDKLYQDFLNSDGVYDSIEKGAKWLVSSLRNTGVEVVKSTAPAAIHGSQMKSGLEHQSSKTPTSSNHPKNINSLPKSILDNSPNNQGVQSMKK